LFGGSDQFLRILGSAKLGNLSNKKSLNLLSVLEEFGINLIDTAPSYPRSEQRIGNFLKAKSVSTLRVMTKFGRDSHILDRETLKVSLGLSLQRLKVEQLHGISVHNRNEFEIHEGIFEEAMNLKSLGLISQFGWCGDWNKIPTKTLVNYDFVMLPVNPFIPNVRDKLKEIKIPVIAMNPFANFFWNYKKWGKLEEFYNEKFREKFNPYPHKYIGQDFTSRRELKDLLEFVLKSGGLNAICFGTTSVNHVNEICKNIDIILRKNNTSSKFD
jgi:aryl-alcohol dehydrogenase-like predicted oxidoreductase